MPKSSEKHICAKCGKLHFCDEHHILPKGLFGNGETAFLCKNCHYEFHKALGFKYLRKKNKQPSSFYIEKYLLWLSSLIVLALIIYFVK